MAHYHPVSYEAEARIRQHDKLQSAGHHRQLKAVRGGRSPLRPALSLLAFVRDGLVTAVRAVAPSSQPRRYIPESD